MSFRIATPPPLNFATSLGHNTFDTGASEPRSPRKRTHLLEFFRSMAGLPSSWETLQSVFLDVESRLVSWAGLDGQRAGTGLMAVLCSLGLVLISWKFLLRCRLSLKLRRMSRTVPSIR